MVVVKSKATIRVREFASIIFRPHLMHLSANMAAVAEVLDNFCNSRSRQRAQLHLSDSADTPIS